MTQSFKKLIKLSQVIAITGLSRATIYNYVNAGIFPQYAKVGRSSFWEYNEIQKWIADRLDERNRTTK